MNTTANRWTSAEDELFRTLVNSRASSSCIAHALNRTEDELKKRGYLIGLPLKWFKTSDGIIRVPERTMFAQLSNDYHQGNMSKDRESYCGAVLDGAGKERRL